MAGSRFSFVAPAKAPRGRQDKQKAILNLGGLDMTTPNDLMDKGRTPSAKNFRLYAQEADERGVAVSTRKGSGFYVNPLGEEMAQSVDSTRGTKDFPVGVNNNICSQSFIAKKSGFLTKVDVKIKKSGKGSGTVLASIYNYVSGAYCLLAQTSLSSGDMSTKSSFVSGRFLGATEIVENQKYFIILQEQDDATGECLVETTTSANGFSVTDSSLENLKDQGCSLNYKVYVTQGGADKGSYRFNRDNASNITVVAFGDALYKINPSEKRFDKIIGGLNPLAEEYRFTVGDGKLFFVNGFDKLMTWDGTDENTNPNKLINGNFTDDLRGWAGQYETYIERDTIQYHSAPASLRLNNTAGKVRSGACRMSLEKFHRYKISFWAKGDEAKGTIEVAMKSKGGKEGTHVSGVIADSVKNITTEWTKYEFYNTPQGELLGYEFNASETNVNIDDIEIVDTGFEIITNKNLPIASDVIMHKSRLFIVAAGEPNLLKYSNAPAAPTTNHLENRPAKPNEQWYYDYPSVNFYHVPGVKTGSPITAIVPFQDSLTIFTQDKKYTWSGFDRGSFLLRESTGSKGCLSRRGAIADENNVYFVAKDGLYSYNGAKDTKISSLVSPLFNGCTLKNKITPVHWKNQIRFYMGSQNSKVNDICLIFDKDLNELMLDTGTYKNRGVFYQDADDNQQLIEFGSLYPIAVLGEQGYSELGSPIDFEYRLKYDSLDLPAQRKRIKRFYPLIQSVDSTFKIDVSMDKDFQNSPRIKQVLLVRKGAKFGEFDWDDGSTWGGSTSFKPRRQSYSGYAYYWQFRIARKAVNNRIAFIGVNFSYKTKRL